MLNIILHLTQVLLLTSELHSVKCDSISRSAGREHNCLLLWHTQRLIIFIITPPNVKHLFFPLIDKKITSRLY